MWDSVKMWWFIRKFKEIELRYDRAPKQPLDPRLFVAGSEMNLATKAYNISLAKEDMVFRECGFTSIPRMHLVSELSKSIEVEDRKDLQKTIDLCLHEGFLEKDESNKNLSQLILTPHGERFGGWFIFNLYFLQYLTNKFKSTVVFFSGLIVGLSSWLVGHMGYFFDLLKQLHF